ncbi:MAG: hypothetical protein HC799_03775 [Limnothrix sp. RL_2_0]|nr:hypothetical protein [Limnothrix sp. RL_2_0]
MNTISLIHPIYLDIPMLVSFAAALQGGFSLEAEVTAEKKRGNTISGDAAGKIGLSKLFTVIGEAEGNAEFNGNRSQEVYETRKESKAYTEASIAIRLYHQLREAKGYIFEPKDFNDFTQYSPGTLIEVGGVIKKNAVYTVIDCIDAVSILSKMATPPKPKSPSSKKGFSAHRSEEPELKYIRDVLDEDRQRTPLSNILLKCSQPPNLNAIVTLRTANLRDLTLSELNQNSVRIVGKITRKISEGEKVNSFENYGMAMLNSESLRTMFSQITSQSELSIDFSEIEVSGPAIQILPLMIFV